MSNSFLVLKNCQPDEVENVPLVKVDSFVDLITKAVVRDSERLTAFFAVPWEKGFKLFGVLANDTEGRLKILSSLIDGQYPSITRGCSQAHWFEREIWENYGIIPEGHPWLKPIRFSYYKKNGCTEQGHSLPGVTEYFKVDGEEIHEVAVGPVHAGIIEPGHFRFQCHGETVLHLEISLGYQHRGVEKNLLLGPNKKTIHYFETIAGDTTIGHLLTYLQLRETLSGIKVPSEAETMRAICLELERLANHTGDLGALANDVGYLPTASYCGRIRGDFLNLTALLCGNRFGRSMLSPGGINFNIEAERLKKLADGLEKAYVDICSAVDLLWASSSVMARFQNTGVISASDARGSGLVGVAARASGQKIDVRADFPLGEYQGSGIKKITHEAGDVYARARVRWLEIKESVRFIKEKISLLSEVQASEYNDFLGNLGQNKIVVSLTEGWRGEICHVAITDQESKFKHYKVIDPSFHNWFALALAMRGEQISDFPLCNKSFNLSYCGHDL